MRDFARKRVPDLVGAGLLVALGVAFALGSLRYGLVGESSRLGPGFVPFAAGISLIVFGGFIGGQTWRSREESLQQIPGEPEGDLSGERPVLPEAGERDPQEQGPETGDEGGSSRTVALVFGLTLVTILLAPVLGFLVSFGLLVLALVTFVERQGFLLGLALSIGAAAITWLLFVRLLQVPLPPGILVSGFGG